MIFPNISKILPMEISQYIQIYFHTAPYIYVVYKGGGNKDLEAIRIDCFRDMFPRIKEKIYDR